VATPRAGTCRRCGGPLVGRAPCLTCQTARPREPEFVSGDFFDFVRIAFQFLDLLFEKNVFLVELIDVGFHPVDFLLGAAHGEIAVRAENIVDYEGEQKKTEQRAAMLAKPGGGSFVCFRFF